MMPRTIIIEPVLNGFVVQVGCQRVVMKTPEELADGVCKYYKNPAETEKRYLEIKVNDTTDNPAVTSRPPEHYNPVSSCEDAPRGLRR